ncbi:hypothetical protein ACTOWA_04815 [Herbaspirillum seropedicae]|uniref:hypothetical protein n=1 Tax=Herbaspirillum seropedicae TaxID=964 RepID=UPI003F8D4F02
MTHNPKRTVSPQSIHSPLKFIVRRWSFFVLLSKERVAWKIVAFVWAGWGVAGFFRDEIALLGDDQGLKVLNYALSIPLVWWGVISAGLFLIWLIESAYRVVQRQTDLIVELEKVDRSDLSHMLGGIYYENTFFYKGEITLCKQFKGKFEIEQLKDVFTEIPVRAPKYSWARIRLKWSNSDQLTAKYRFYIVDQDGNPKHIENIYEDLSIFLDDRSCFSLKLTYDENYKIEETAELWVTVSSWRK